MEKEWMEKIKLLEMESLVPKRNFLDCKKFYAKFIKVKA